VLVGADNGAYPSGNTLLVRGASEAVLIDPSVTVVARGGAPARVDAVINSHAHEDHMAGNGMFPDARLHIHDDDRLGAVSLDGLMEIYGLDGAARSAFAEVLVEQFHYTPRPDARGFTDGAVFDLGGGVSVEAVHLPGHTRGHSGVRMDGVFFLSDIDLTGFGPYYGDVWSDLEDFEASLATVRDAHDRRDGRPPFHLPTPRRDAVRRIRRAAQRPDARRSDGATGRGQRGRTRPVPGLLTAPGRMRPCPTRRPSRRCGRRSTRATIASDG
jgi:glyoxylase-like metal-dependent hydrolase (beta-lactamase superfamily II)